MFKLVNIKLIIIYYLLLILTNILFLNFKIILYFTYLYNYNYLYLYILLFILEYPEINYKKIIIIQ
jgi:hypothetical protein